MLRVTITYTEYKTVIKLRWYPAQDCNWRAVAHIPQEVTPRTEDRRANSIRSQIPLGGVQGELFQKGVEFFHDQTSNSPQALLVGGLKSQDEDRLSIGCPDQSPAIWKENPRAVDIDNPMLPFELLRQLRDNVEFLVIRAFHPDFRGIHHFGYARQEIREPSRRAGEDFEQSCAGIDGVVISEVPIREE